MLKRTCACGCLGVMVLGWTAASEAKVEVELVRTPHRGLQPQVVAEGNGTLHLVYFKGSPSGGNLFYVRRPADSSTWSRSIRVNHLPNGAVATGTIRGAQLALGKQGRVHVVWNGSQDASAGDDKTTPLFYTRTDETGDGFEPERNVITYARGLDGGSSVAADDRGNVYVVWHAPLADRDDEAGRAVFVAKSTDEGKTFAREESVNPPTSGVCACCGLKAFANRRGQVFVLYRTARDWVHRDMMLLVSEDEGRRFQSRYAHPWTVSTCPMSSASLTESSIGTLAAWETREQVYWAWIKAMAPQIADPVNPIGSGKRKHPSVASNAHGDVLLAWTEGAGWAKGGFLEWQVFDRQGEPISKKGRVNGVPAWSLPAACAKLNGDFVIIY